MTNISMTGILLCLESTEFHFRPPPPHCHPLDVFGISASCLGPRCLRLLGFFGTLNPLSHCTPPAVPSRGIARGCGGAGHTSQHLLRGGKLAKIVKKSRKISDCNMFASAIKQSLLRTAMTADPRYLCGSLAS